MYLYKQIRRLKSNVKCHKQARKVKTKMTCLIFLQVNKQNR